MKLRNKTMQMGSKSYVLITFGSYVLQRHYNVILLAGLTII